MPNALFYGDNLEILRRNIKDESVDLVYLDPPFNSKATYNVLYAEPGTKIPSLAQIAAFEDTWHWTQETENTFQEIIDIAPVHVVEMMRAFRSFIGMNDMMAYLTMMCIRLLELRRVMKNTGSIYLHCDSTASHYLKIVIDSIFGGQNFQNEIIWKRTSGHSDAHRFGRVHDVLLFYTKSSEFTWNQQYQPYSEEYIKQYYRYKEKDGRLFMSDNLSASGLSGGGYEYEWNGVTRVWRVPEKTMKRLDEEGRVFYTKNGMPRRKRYLDESLGLPMQDIWTDIEALRSWHKENLEYPTQKPEALLERIISASSNEGDAILDPFCGCGTTVVVAQRLRRQWVGIDITHLAINLIKNRLKGVFGIEQGKDYEVFGEPVDLAGAKALAAQDRYQAQWWVDSLLGARPYKDKKKGADTGIDGLMYFTDEKSKTKKVIVQVKTGHISVKDIRDLGHVIDREGADIGVFATLESPTKTIITEAVGKGLYKSPFNGEKYPRIQILTVEEILAGKKPSLPPSLTSFRESKPAQETGDVKTLFDTTDDIRED